MGNMSYCRFENTARDLQDCVNAIDRGETDELNEYEKSGLADILKLAEYIVDMEDYINDILEDNEDQNIKRTKTRKKLRLQTT